MCEEAKRWIVGYMDALEEYDRLHLMFLAAYRRSDTEAMEGYRGVLQESKLKVQSARARFQDHQQAHNCSEVVHLEDV
jgi:hypothetical protein